MPGYERMSGRGDDFNICNPRRIENDRRMWEGSSQPPYQLQPHPSAHDLLRKKQVFVEVLVMGFDRGERVRSTLCGSAPAAKKTTTVGTVLPAIFGPARETKSPVRFRKPAVETQGGETHVVHDDRFARFRAARHRGGRCDHRSHEPLGSVIFRPRNVRLLVRLLRS